MIEISESEANVSIINCGFFSVWVGHAAIYIENSFKISIFDSIVEGLNKNRGKQVSYGGSAIFLKNVKIQLFHGLKIRNSFSDLTAVGIKILDGVKKFLQNASSLETDKVIL